MSSRIIRVFPRITKATPRDPLAARNRLPGFFDQADEIHISVAFTYDRARADLLEREWRHVAPVRIGGPGVGDSGGEFVPGKYLRNGFVITSRGCPNRCWFCDVWRREGAVRELPICEGWIVQDDNLLACSEGHIRAVFAMLKRQKAVGQRVEFAGGLEAARLKAWHCDELAALNPKQIFFAFDDEEGLEPLRVAGAMLRDRGFSFKSRKLRCFVLCGYPKDHLAVAETRMEDAVLAGFWPMAMLYRDQQGHVRPDWRSFQREWSRPAIISTKVKELCRNDSRRRRGIRGVQLKEEAWKA